MKDWNTYMLELAQHIATKSKDPSRQVGCVIIGPDKEIRSTGFNGFPRGVHEGEHLEVTDLGRGVMNPVTLVDDSDRWGRPQKYDWVEHAERNAIYNAARMGIPLKGCTAYITLAPCAACSRALIQAGITTVYGPQFPIGEEYKDYGFDTSVVMLVEAGVNYQVIEEPKKKKPCPVCGSGDWSCGH